MYIGVLVSVCCVSLDTGHICGENWCVEISLT